MIFKDRHIGITPDSQQIMLAALNHTNIDSLCTEAMGMLPTHKLPTKAPMSESELEHHMIELGKKNIPTLNVMGQGFFPNYCPAIIRRNILENPSWYTQYTPYQAEISQGRLEALFNFQTCITELTGLPIANASLLDEGNAGSEAIFMAIQHHRNTRTKVWVCTSISPHNRAVIRTRFKYLGITITEGPIQSAPLDDSWAAILAGSFNEHGDYQCLHTIFSQAKTHGIVPILNADPLALTLYPSAAELTADICVGSSQRLGVSMGYGGPSAAFISCLDDYKRLMPGRIIGLSKDRHGRPAYRMALQTREQHIRREKATSNICTAQSLLAIISSFYVIYHGPAGLTAMAKTIQGITQWLSRTLNEHGFTTTSSGFDTITISTNRANELTNNALKNSIEWVQISDTQIQLGLNETLTANDIQRILQIFEISIPTIEWADATIPAQHQRTQPFLRQPVFHDHYSETKLLRYIKSLETKDLSLANAMIPLGSCTMKLNGTVELLSLSNPAFTQIHPLSHPQFTQGYQHALTHLENALTEITGFDATSLQPNSGAQGEFAGLMSIRHYFDAIKESHRDVAFIPTSAHGTNPASASLCGLRMVPIKCLDSGDICSEDLSKKLQKYGDSLAVLMVTYPSTFGVFDSNIQHICQMVHDAGGQVYMDGANMNAQVGLTAPALVGADVCHLNLHKTFCIPHGGGGPGVGPICVKSHLAPYLPGQHDIAIANAPYGSASICLISYAYIQLMGYDHLKTATQVAILNANYMAYRLRDHFNIMFTNKHQRVAHELIIDCKPFKKSHNITVEDIAKRLMDYGFHAPTMSWPVPDSLMIEPTESEGKAELDRFCDAMIAIQQEIHATDPSTTSNILKNAPHTTYDLYQEWPHDYTRESACFPVKDIPKFWPSVNRIDNAHGDRHLICSCQNIMVDTKVKEYELNH